MAACAFCQQATVILEFCSGVISLTVSRYFGQVQYQSLVKSFLWFCDTTFFFFPCVGFFFEFFLTQFKGLR